MRGFDRKAKSRQFATASITRRFADAASVKTVCSITHSSTTSKAALSFRPVTKKTPAMLQRANKAQDNLGLSFQAARISRLRDDDCYRLCRRKYSSRLRKLGNAANAASAD